MCFVFICLFRDWWEDLYKAPVWGCRDLQCCEGEWMLGTWQCSECAARIEEISNSYTSRSTKQICSKVMSYSIISQTLVPTLACSPSPLPWWGGAWWRWTLTFTTLPTWGPPWRWTQTWTRSRLCTMQWGVKIRQFRPFLYDFHPLQQRLCHLLLLVTTLP